MPTTLFAQHHPFDTPEYFADRYLHHSTPLHIISEHEYFRSLIPSVAQRDPRVKSPPLHPLDSSIGKPLRPLRIKQPPRPLMATMTFTAESNMAMEGLPGSPPDLTSSKSSKSSSFHSTSLSDIMGPSDLSHFEEINLDDLQGAYSPASFPLPTSPSNRVVFEAPRTSLSSISSNRSNTLPQGVHSFRDLTGTAKPRNPNLQLQVNNPARNQPQGLGLGLGASNRNMRRGLSSPSAPSLANSNLLPGGRRSRSPSPSHPQVFSSAPRSLSRRSSRNLDVTLMNPQSRRQSWQHPTRKTAKEREAECDEDDDEVPEDATLANVPISPRPPQERSPVPSAPPSPPRRVSSLAASRPTSRGGSPASARTAPIVQRKFSQPPSPNPSHDDNASTASSLSRPRTNTWEETYTTLDSDSKKLTEALEQHQEDSERIQEEKRQQPGLSRSASVESPKPLAKTRSLPPLRKSDPLIDPFQPSREKERYLSRTRPSWLPPKDPKEEKRHLKEYEKMRARIEEAGKPPDANGSCGRHIADLISERIQAAREEEQRKAREQSEIVKAKLWEQLIPQWDTQVRPKDAQRTNRRMWWEGIPPRFRGQVWKRAIGNELEISATTFEIALKKAKGTEEVASRRGSVDLTRTARIQENTKRVFPASGLFAPGMPYHQDLVDLCLAYTEYRPDVESLAGIHFIGGLLLLNMDVTDAFACLCNLLNRPLPLSFLLKDRVQMTRAYHATLDALALKAPSLAKRLEELQVEPKEYLEPMFMSLFCDRLSVEHASRVMDVYCVEGDKIPPRVAVGVLMMVEGRLYEKSNTDVLKVIGKDSVSESGGEQFALLNPSEFMEVVFEGGKA